MPIYEYHCDACGQEFEVMQKIADRPIRKCEICGRLKAKRIISQTSFILRGSGWYVTDYKGKIPSDNGHKGGDKEASGSSTETAPNPAPSSAKTESNTKTATA
jgi:putative FmdB family regulatory protein